jgi:hypothetical protein
VAREASEPPTPSWVGGSFTGASPPACCGSTRHPPAALVVPDASCSESEFVPGGLRTRGGHVRRRPGRRSTCPQGRVSALPPLTNLGLPAKPAPGLAAMLLRAQADAGGPIGPIADMMAGVGPIVAPGPTGGMGRFRPSQPRTTVRWLAISGREVPRDSPGSRFRHQVVTRSARIPGRRRPESFPRAGAIVGRRSDVRRREDARRKRRHGSRLALLAARSESRSILGQGFEPSSGPQSSEQEIGMFASLTSRHSRLRLES